MPEPTPEAWAQIRHAYEHSGQPIAGICTEHGITEPMLRYRVKRWGWRKRRALIPVQGPPAVVREGLHPPLEGEGRRAMSEARGEPGWGDGQAQQLHPTPLQLADASRSDPPPPGEGDTTTIVPRLQSAVTRLLPAIESVVSQLASGPHSPHAMAQAARALSSLTRTLRELNALLAQYNAQAKNVAAQYDDDMPEDMDEFRIKLTQRIQAFLASRANDDFACAGEPSAPGEAKPPEPC